MVETPLRRCRHRHRRSARARDRATGDRDQVRFEEALSIRTADRAAQPLNVSLREWVVRNQQKTILTASGVLVVQLRAGGLW